MPVTTVSLADLYSEIADLARDQGVNNKEGWDELVDDVIEDHLDLGEIDLDQDTEGMKDDLRARWTTYKEDSSGEESGAVIDDGEDDDFKANFAGDDDEGV